MELLENVAALFRMFTDPAGYAIQSVRGSTWKTLNWTLGYIGFLLLAYFFASQENVDKVGRTLLAILYLLAAFTAAGILKRIKSNQAENITYGEAAVLYLTNLAVLLTVGTIARLGTPYGQTSGPLDLVYLVWPYFLFFAHPKMLSALLGRPSEISIVRFFVPFVVGFITWTLIALGATHLLGENSPLGQLLTRLP